MTHIGCTERAAQRGQVSQSVCTHRGTLFVSPSAFLHG